MPAFILSSVFMTRPLIRLLALVTFLAGCSGRGCVSEDRIHVLYRGTAELAEGAAVRREADTVGYIEKIARSPGLQRATLRVQAASAFTKGDRFIAALDEKKKLGLAAKAGEGEALSNGAEIEADPKFELRKYYAAMAPNAPGGITLPSGVYVPYPRGLTDTGNRERRMAKKERRMIEKTLEVREQELARYEKVPPALMNRFQDMQSRLKTMDKKQALEMLRTEGEVLLEDLEQAQHSAMERHDRAAAEDAKQLSRLIHRGRLRLEREVARDERIGPRKVREGFVPPDFR